MRWMILAVLALFIAADFAEARCRRQRGRIFGGGRVAASGCAACQGR